MGMKTVGCQSLPDKHPDSTNFRMRSRLSRAYDMIELLHWGRKPLFPLATLIERVMATCPPGSWTAGGRRGVVREIRGVLVISQTYQNQRKITELLDDLRKPIKP